MAIERLSFPEYLGLNLGVPFNLLRDPAGNRVSDLLKYYGRMVRVLPEGEYDLTPDNHPGRLFRQNLVVFADGTALFRILSMSEEAGIFRVETANSEITGDLKPGGRITRVPDDMSVVLVTRLTDPKSADGAGRLFEIISFTPGASPSR